jgi:hypothetical protein
MKWLAFVGRHMRTKEFASVFRRNEVVVRLNRLFCDHYGSFRNANFGKKSLWQFRFAERDLCLDLNVSSVRRHVTPLKSNGVAKVVYGLDSISGLKPPVIEGFLGRIGSAYFLCGASHIC